MKRFKMNPLPVFAWLRFFLAPFIPVDAHDLEQWITDQSRGTTRSSSHPKTTPANQKMPPPHDSSPANQPTNQPTNQGQNSTDLSHFRNQVNTFLFALSGSPVVWQSQLPFLLFIGD